MIQTSPVQAQISVTICAGETAVLNSTIIPPSPPPGPPCSPTSGSGGGGLPGMPGGGAIGLPSGEAHEDDDCSQCLHVIERLISNTDDLIDRNGDSFVVAPVITTGYLISSRYIPTYSPDGPTSCQSGGWANEKFVVLVEDCSNNCPANNNLGNEILAGSASHSSELLTCFQGTINDDANIELKSEERIKLDRGFKILQGAELQVRIEACN